MQVCGSCAEDVQEPEDAPEASAAGARGAGAGERCAGISSCRGAAVGFGEFYAVGRGREGERKHSPILHGTKPTFQYKLYYI